MTDIEYEEATEDDVLDELSEPVVMEKSDVESLKETVSELNEELEGIDEDTLEELRSAEDPVVVEKNDYEENQALVDEVSKTYAEELSEYSPFDTDELTDKFSVSELQTKVEEHEDASIVEELGESDEDPEPEAGSPDAEELEDEPEEYDEEELRSEIAGQLESSGMDRQAQKVRDGDIALEELGVEL